MSTTSQQPRAPIAQDLIRVRNILLTPSFTDGAQWAASPPRPKLQPAYVTLELRHPISQAAATDGLEHTINYSTVCKTIIEASNARPFSSAEDFLQHTLDKCFTDHPQVHSLTLTLRRPKALLQPACCEVVVSSHRVSTPWIQSHSISNLECYPIVGVNDCERLQKQLVRFDISLTVHERALQAGNPLPIRQISETITAEVAKTQYLTLEALVSLVARTILASIDLVSSVTVRGGKPNALSCAEAAEVEITRTAADYGIYQSQGSVPSIASRQTPSVHSVAIALGSNLGDRFANIEFALRLLERPGVQYSDNNAEPYVSVTDTSFLYETEPMYVTDQPKFINCTCLVETNIEPVPLLKFLKDIETRVGRVETFRNGPRAIDLDILTYDSVTLDTRNVVGRGSLENLTGHLVIPHPRLPEREFVLRPLNDIIPDYVHPILRRPVRTLLEDLFSKEDTDTPVMNKVIPFPNYPFNGIATEEFAVPETSDYWVYSTAPATSSRTHLMATLNATPDSFSDGALHNTVPTALSYATSAVAAGADIIDVGGYSTRPGATFVSAAEELSRVVSVITAIRETEGSEQGSKDVEVKRHASRTLLSVDTFRWDVAEAAVRAGANCINDVYAFTGPTYPVDQTGRENLQKLRSIASDLAVPVILMHSRGEASANKDYSEYNYAADRKGRGAVVEAVKIELGRKVDAIVKGKGGVRRWHVIVDPGIGFSKTVEGNLELLRDCASIVRQGACGRNNTIRNPLAGYPMLIGTSRKSFLGAILAQPSGGYQGRETKPTERGWATAAAVACAVQQGANVVRVHDVLEQGDVVRISESLRA